MCAPLRVWCIMLSFVLATSVQVFLLMSGKIEVELQSDDQNYVKEIKPVTRFWIPEGDRDLH